jgi:uncharacterized membrane protein YgdD (TMEM256/DUF423 family)
MNSLLGNIFTFAASALSLLFGMIYLTKPKFMSYHRMAVQKDWNELNPEMRTLITALMRALSSGFLSVAFALAYLQLKFNREGEHWIALAILIIGSILASGSLYAMILIRMKTNGRPPILPVSLIFALLIAGYFFNIYH